MIVLFHQNGFSVLDAALHLLDGLDHDKSVFPDLTNTFLFVHGEGGKLMMPLPLPPT